MKLVKEHINEKFREDSDPIHDMGIGIFSKRNFDTVEEATDFIYDALPAIIKTGEIPKDIIESNTNTYKWKYYWEIKHYCLKYISINGVKIRNRVGGHFTDIYEQLRDKLLYKGCGKTYTNRQTSNPYRNEIYEKFIQGSDPIKDMHIGIFDKYFDTHINRVGSYVFVERGPDFVKGGVPTTYIYAKSGNVYRKHPHLWMAQELRSASSAFHKENPNKMPVKDLDEAKEFIIKHYLNARKREGLKI